MEKRVLGVADQRRLLRDTSTVDVYKQFASARFGGERFVDDVASYAEQYAQAHGEQVPADHMQLITLSNLLVAQYGWGRLEGHYKLHDRPKRKHHIMSTPNILATTVFIAGLNVEAHPYKEELAEQVDPEYSDGIWGSPLNVKEGKVFPKFRYGEKPSRDIIWSAKDRARNRLIYNSNPLHLPDLELNETIVKALDGFDGSAADAVTIKEFEEEIFPELKTAINTLGIPDDPKPIFTAA